MKILVSACVMGSDVRWNGANKNCDSVKSWAAQHGFELVPVCPEDFLFGTPRRPIRMIHQSEKTAALMGENDVLPVLSDYCRDLHKNHSDAAGFIGVSNSPTCGIAVGVKNLGKVVKGQMHYHAEMPTTEVSQMQSEKNRDMFYRRVMKYANCTLRES